MLDLVVSIVNHNSVQPLQTCLQSLKESALRISYDVYVVDNLCEERAEEMLSQEFPAVKVITNSRVLGFGANHNRVLACTLEKTRYVLILNPDTNLSAGAIQQMVEFMDSHENVAICGPRLMNENGESKKPVSKVLSLRRDTALLCLYVLGVSRSLYQRILSLSPKHSLKRSSNVKGNDAIASPHGPRVVFCEAVEGSCMLVRNESLRRIGLFDERFFMYYEEADLCLRALLGGWQIAYLPEAEVLHSGAYSTKRSYLTYLSVFARSCLLFYGKHQGRMAVWILRTSMLSAVAANVLRWSFQYAIRPSRRREAIAWLEFSRGLLRMAFQPV